MNSKKVIQFELLFKATKKALKDTIDDIKSYSTGIAVAINNISKMTELTERYIGSQRILNHTFGEGSKQVSSYVNRLSEMLGISKANVSQSVALFGQLGSSLGMNTELAQDFSKALADLSARISIMYAHSTDYTTASKAVLGAMKGEVRTLATITGISVKSQAQQNMLDRLGINAKVGELNATNQALLKYLTVSERIMESDENMAIYAESVAYQKKVLTNQVKNLTQAFGNFLYPVLKAILPVINGVLMALTELVNFFANMLGVTDTITNEIGASATAFDDFGNSIETSANKAKKGLRGFDKLNNITTPTSDTSGINSGANAKLIEEMNKMSEKMLEIRMRATEISEAILKWLGFEKINGKLEFTGVKLGTILGILAGAGGILWAITKIVNTFKSIKGIINGLKNIGKAGDLLSKSGKLSESTKSFQLPNVRTVLKGIGELVLIITALGAFVLAVGELTKINGFTEIMNSGLETLKTLFTELSQIMIPLALFSAGIAILGNTTSLKNMIVGLGDLAVVIDGTALVIASLGLLSKIPYFNDLVSGGIELFKTVFSGLGEMLLPLGVLSGVMIVLGIATPATILSGLAGFALVIDGTAIVIASLGALTEIPHFTQLVNGGLKLMEDMFYGLGKVAGALIGGVGAGISAGLPEIGSNLSKFAENAKSFFEITSGFSSDTALGIKYLAEALLVLTGAELMNNLNGTNLKSFINNLMGKTTDSLFVKFGKQLAEFAPYFVDFSEKIKDVKSDAVLGSTNAINALIELSRKVPNTGGIKDWLTGKNDIDVWGEKLPKFGTALKQYSLNVEKLSHDVVTKSRDSAMALVELASRIPTAGGLKALFVGNNSIDTWGYKLQDFGWYFNLYASYVGALDIPKINNVTGAISNLVDVATKIKDNGITDTLKKFGDKLSSSANSFVSFFSIRNAYNIGYDFGDSLASGISNALKKHKYPNLQLKEDNVWGNTLKTFPIQVRANGGFVDSGEMYIARENGLSEFIGRIGSHTAVANNDQIVEAVASGVARANKATQSKTPVVIEAKGDASGLLDFITFKQKEQDRQFGL